MTQAPWWGVPVIAGSFLIIGGVLGFLSNFLLERSRRKREDRTQYRDRLVDTIADFLDAHRTMRERRPGKGHADNDQRMKDVDQQYERMQRQAALIELLASDLKLHSAAYKAVAMHMEYCDNGDFDRPVDYQEITRLRLASNAAHDEFLATARLAIGVVDENQKRRH